MSSRSGPVVGFTGRFRRLLKGFAELGTSMERLDIEKGLLNCVEFAGRGESLYGGHFAVSYAGGGNRAGLSGAAIEEDSAGTAGTFAAAILRPGEKEVIAEEFQ